MATGAMHGDGVVVGMNTGFHENSILVWPVCTALAAYGVSAASLGHDTIADYTGKPERRKTRV
jgi:hypothetical protein